MHKNLFKKHIIIISVLFIVTILSSFVVNQKYIRLEVEKRESTSENKESFVSTRRKTDKGLHYYVFGTDKDSQYIGIVYYDGKETNIIVPDSINDIAVTAIHSNGFMEKRIDTIELPKTITLIRNNAFEGCIGLKKLIVKSMNAKIETDILGDNMNVTICAPKGSTAEKYAYENGLTFEELPLN